MADIRTDPAGRRRFTYRDRHGRRREMRLGRLPLKQARGIPERVQALASALAVGAAPDPATAAWVAGLGDGLRKRLADHGLVQARQTATLGAFVERWIDERADVKPATVATYGRARQKLLAFYGASTPLQDITPGSGDTWRRAMLAGDAAAGVEPLAEATVRKAVSIAGQIMRSAVRHRLLEADPFADLPTSPPANRSRDHFVTRDEAAAVLDSCPDAGWRCAFALARFGGLRIPSELHGLKLADIDWGGDGRAARFTVTSPKTARTGKPSRVVPLFPALEPWVRAAYEATPEGAVYLLPDEVRLFPSPGVKLARFLRSAGVEPWPKLWQNLRASAETELMETHPSHVVLAWIGHTRAVAERHYLQVTEGHFAAAAEAEAGGGGQPTGGAASAAGAASNRQGEREPDRRAARPEAEGVARVLAPHGAAGRGTESRLGAGNRPDGPGRGVKGVPAWAILDSNQ